MRDFLRSPHFQRLYATRLISAVADGIFQAGLASYVLFNPQNATTPSRAAAAFAALLLPYSLVGPFAGVFLDRWYRQRVLVVGNSVKVVLVLGVAALVFAGNETLAFFVTAIAALGVNRLFLAALSAALPHVVSEDQLVTANALSTTSGSIATIGGVGVGGLIRVVFGSGAGTIGAIVLVSAGIYALSAGVASTMRRDLLGPDADGRARSAVLSTWRSLATVVAELRAATAHIASRRKAADALGAVSAHRFLYGMGTLTIVLLFRNYFAGAGNVTSGLVGLGAVLGASGVGIFVAALITPAMTRRIGKAAWITALLLAAGVGFGAFGLSFQRPLLVVGAFVLAVSAQGVKICVDTTLQEVVDDSYRGRVFSVYDMLYNVTYVAAAAVAATVLPTSGKSVVVMAALGIGYLVAAAAFALVSRGQPVDAPAAAPPADGSDGFEPPIRSSQGSNRP
jgi:MFS family permease